MGTANGKKKYPNDPEREVFEAARSGDAVLLKEVFQEMNSSERTSALETKMDASFRYGVNEYETFKVTSLIIAVKNGNLDCVKVLLKYKADIECRGGDDEDGDGRGVKLDRKYCQYSCRGCTPLIVAATYGHLDVLSCLIANGADVSTRSKYNSTALMIASRYGHLNIVMHLIEHGVNIDLEDKIGKTALHYAVRYYLNKHLNSFGVLSCLIKNGADVNARIGTEFCTLLMIASKNHNVNLVTFLIEQGANMDLQDKNGKTALHYAVDSFDVLSCLIRNGADVNACTNSDCTPLMEASFIGHLNAVILLVECGANMDQRDNNGDTALHYAVRGNSSDEVLYKRLSLGASELYNSQGLTPLLLVSNLCTISVVEDLIKVPKYTKEQRIDALELLGASLAADQDVEAGFQYIKRGMEERFADPSHPLLKQPMEPVTAYQSRKESQTLEDLAQIEGDVDAILMESLVIGERILGSKSSALVGLIRSVADRYKMKTLDKFTSIGLYKHAVMIAHSIDESAFSDLFELTWLLFEEAQSNDPPSQQVLIESLEQTVVEYEIQQKLRTKLGKCGRAYCEQPFDLDGLLAITGNLAYMIPKFKNCEEGKPSCVLLLLKRLCYLNPRGCGGNTLLHDVVESQQYYFSYAVRIQTVKLLLNAGFDVNAVNNDGDTPLHRAVTYQFYLSQPGSGNIHLMSDMLEVLLDAGAHYDFVNNGGKTAMDMAKANELHKIIYEKRKLELKCISARAVKKFGLPYLGVVPKTLEKYISMH